VLFFAVRRAVLDRPAVFTECLLIYLI
jgi:hypothetical protein